MNDKSANAAIYGGCYLTLVAYLVASYFSEFRVWGFNWWAYYPSWVRWGLFGLGALAPVVVQVISRRFEYDSQEEVPVGSDRRFYAIAGLVTAASAVLFYFLRARIHFLGDGYTLLSSLAADQPTTMKIREYGESLLHICLKNLIGGDGQASALLSYQIISITAGLLFVVAVALFARKLYERTVERVLFLLGICTGGYMLLFFGYVENYSLFVLSVLVYTLTGLLIVQGKATRYWLLPPLIAAIFFHVLGVTLIPSAIYAFIAPTRLGRRIARWKRNTKVLAGLFLAASGVVVFYHSYTTSYFFRFAFVPLLENRFTMEGYTMFSWKHLLDYANLLMILLPGLLVVTASLFRRSWRDILRQQQFKYLLVLTLSVLGAVFIFDPRLGMPRDWDLFSFAGVPVVVFVFSLLLKAEFSTRFRVLATVSVIILGFLCVLPRAVSQANTDVSLGHFESYLLLDKLKSRNAVILLGNYYVEKGNSESAARVRRYALEGYPEKRMHTDAMTNLAQGQYGQAQQILEEIVDRDPFFWNAWTTLGACLWRSGYPAEAENALNIAIGINPHNAGAYNNMGAVYTGKGRLTSAELMYLKSIALDSTSLEPYVGLTNVYRVGKRKQQYRRLLFYTTERFDAPGPMFQERGNFMLAMGRFPEAAKAYRTALGKGLDSSYVQQLIQQHPQLEEYFK